MISRWKLRLIRFADEAHKNDRPTGMAAWAGLGALVMVLCLLILAVGFIAQGDSRVEVTDGNPCVTPDRSDYPSQLVQDAAAVVGMEHELAPGGTPKQEPALSETRVLGVQELIVRIEEVTRLAERFDRALRSAVEARLGERAGVGAEAHAGESGESDKPRGGARF